MINKTYLEDFRPLRTPFYFYNRELLEETLKTVSELSKRLNYVVHYAIKANANRELLKIISSYGLGADCVSGNEVKHALETGFPAENIVFAGVGKTDPEISYALDNGIYCFHCESVQELLTIDELAKRKGMVANVALRLNPNVAANTHAHITTGSIENKFGFSVEEVAEAKQILPSLQNVRVIGLHFHIGSQITDMRVFKNLALRINELQTDLFSEYAFSYLNVGGGLGIDYSHPELHPVADFKSYFDVFADNLMLKRGQHVHFELGRSIIGQCGSLITRVILVKGSEHRKFVVVDAGMNDLIRPALYGAKHKIIKLSASGVSNTYDVVGPVCESADCFARDIELPSPKRGELLAILSSGAYGEVMSSTYNLREKPGTLLSNPLIVTL
jgi:diaminopimelate decarboxylase